MTATEAVARSSADLRSEIARMGGDLDALEGKLILFDDRIAALALSVYRSDPTAAGRMTQCRDLRAKTLEEQQPLRHAKAAAEIELNAALAREKVGRKHSAAAEAEK